MTMIESHFDTPSMVKLPFVLRYAFGFGCQLVAERHREAVMQAKGNALDDFAPFEVGQVAAAVPRRGCLARMDRSRAGSPRSQDRAGSGLERRIRRLVPAAAGFIPSLSLTGEGRSPFEGSELAASLAHFACEVVVIVGRARGKGMRLRRGGIVVHHGSAEKPPISWLADANPLLAKSVISPRMSSIRGRRGSPRVAIVSAGQVDGNDRSGAVGRRTVGGRAQPEDAGVRGRCGGPREEGSRCAREARGSACSRGGRTTPRAGPSGPRGRRHSRTAHRRRSRPGGPR